MCFNTHIRYNVNTYIKCNISIYTKVHIHKRAELRTESSNVTNSYMWTDVDNENKSAKHKPS